MTHVQVPDPDLAAQTAGGDQLAVGRVEGDAPGAARVAAERVQQGAAGDVRHVDVVVAVGGRDPTPATEWTGLVSGGMVITGSII